MLYLQYNSFTCIYMYMHMYTCNVYTHTEGFNNILFGLSVSEKMVVSIA